MTTTPYSEIGGIYGPPLTLAAGFIRATLAGRPHAEELEPTVGEIAEWLALSLRAALTRVRGEVADWLPSELPSEAACRIGAQITVRARYGTPLTNKSISVIGLPPMFLWVGRVAEALGGWLTRANDSQQIVLAYISKMWLCVEQTPVLEQVMVETVLEVAPGMVARSLESAYGPRPVNTGIIKDAGAHEIAARYRESAAWLIKQGASKTVVANAFGVEFMTINNWLKATDDD